MENNYFESDALKKALEKAVEEKSYQLKGVRRTSVSDKNVKKVTIIEHPLDTNEKKSYTSIGLVLWNPGVEYNINTIFQELKCPNCKSENIEKTDRTFHCLDCDFYHADFTSR